MPAAPGESSLAILFADIHYYFSPPTSNPPHHRFSRASYLYLFHNVAENRGKLEIANHAGTPHQDAFSGYLNNLACLTYSYKQPTLFTFSIDIASVQGHEHWHLPSYNETNEQKYLYKIHTLDIYLWTEKDAATLLGHLKGILPAEKLDVRDVPANLQNPAEHRDSMSPVVQQLEKTAIATPIPRAESTTSAQSFPGPPTPAASTSVAAACQAAPMAYNPAAPAAPEPIAYREKTPPLSDEGRGTGLSDAAKYDSMSQQYANIPNPFQSSTQQHTPQQAYFPSQQHQLHHPSMTNFPGPPSQTTPPQPTTNSAPLPPPPPPAGPSPQQYTPTFSPPQPTSPTTFTNRQPSSYGTQSHPSFGPAAAPSPGLNYYTHPYPTQPYQPTEAEMSPPQPQQQQRQTETRTRLEGRVTQVEAGVGRFMKRLDKLW